MVYVFLIGITYALFRNCLVGSMLISCKTKMIILSILMCLWYFKGPDQRVGLSPSFGLVCPEVGLAPNIFDRHWFKQFHVLHMLRIAPICNAAIHLVAVLWAILLLFWAERLVPLGIPNLCIKPPHALRITSLFSCSCWGMSFMMFFHLWASVHLDCFVSVYDDLYLTDL